MGAGGPGAVLLVGLAAAASAMAQQSAVDPAGIQAARIAWLWWAFLAVLTAVFVIVIGTTVWALTRRHRGIDQEPLEHTHSPSAATERKLTRTVGLATAATIVILLALLVSSISTGKAISRLAYQGNSLAVEVVGNQWWWYVRYLNDNPSRMVVTANEIHVPVGRPVMIRGSSRDVIHSFWVPNLHGKIDLIPSRVTTLWIEADRAGRFRGQCAEFCGAQHAHMALWVIAEPEAQFEAWMEAQRQPAREPSDAAKSHGRDVFMGQACVFCHAIQGTTAQGQNAPDLTHLASRSTIAAGTLRNTRGNLGGWIMDPQSVKPGNHMAMIELKPEDFNDLLDYLGSLE